MKHFILMCLLLFIHTSQSQLQHQRSTEGADVFLICKHEGKVQWSKGRDGYRLIILTAERSEEIKKHSADPHNRYSVIDDLDLHIKNVSLSDSGIYYCNATATVNLTVTASDFSKPTESSKSSTEATTPAPEISTSVAQTRKTHNTDQPKPTQELQHQRSTEGADVFLICKHEGKVQWTKGRDGYRLMILTAERSEEIKKHNADPHNRYSVIDDLDLHIKNVSLSDSGIYYCNATATVNLTVTASDFSKPTESSKSSTEATTPAPEISTSVAQTRKTHNTDQPKPTQELHHQRSTEGADVFLICKHEGKVQWSKGRDGYRLMILTAESKEEIKKHSADPHNRYSVGDDLDLHIKNVSLSDSGIYYCNANATVNLTVTAPDLSTTSTRSSTRTEETNKRKNELKATTGSIHRHSEDSTPAPDSSTAFTYYCMKEN
ncbi:uncharacterized protein LOC130417928 isoform X2 [Triplophysa dalaica]|uniref:uncharacterized protein LOC130417928 isoform X2 n=1 Tax=Triplophysa dalaica TaxID=1582913 RepID=UPI0024E01466|nr:uncharacterized protein LOC130417928 isoform X2 [Triplophysa dalaica]